MRRRAPARARASSSPSSAAQRGSGVVALSPAGIRARGAAPSCPSGAIGDRGGCGRRAAALGALPGAGARLALARASAAPAAFWSSCRSGGRDGIRVARARSRHRGWPPAPCLGVRGRASPPGPTGPSFGVGAAVALARAHRRASRARSRGWGAFGGDTTVATIVVVIAGLLLLFIFFPVGKALVAALFDAQGQFAPGLAAQRLLTADIWGLGCFGGGTRCGVAINSALLATIVGVAARRCSASCSRWSCSAAGSATPALREADVDPADHHAAVRASRWRWSCCSAAPASSPAGCPRRSAFRARAGSTACRA